MTLGKAVQFGYTMLLREWRSGDIRALIYATIMAVTSITTVTFFTDRIQQALLLQASELLAADLRLRSDHEIKPEYIERAREHGLEVTQFKTFRSMVLFNGRPKLIEVKAVGQAYPLRGKLQLQGSDHAARGPVAGSIWIGKPLQQQLGVQRGDSVQLGNKRFTVAAIISKEPDRAADMFSIAPRVIMPLADLEATQLIQEGSRVRYFLLLAGTGSAVAAYRKAVTPLLSAEERIEGVKDARNEIRTAMQRAEQFFGLVAVVSLLLSLTAIGIAARRYAERNIKLCAIIRCLGSRQRDINRIFFCQLLIVGMLASAIGVVIGWLSHHVIAVLVGKMLLVSLPPASFWPIVTGMLIGMLGVMIVALPPVLHLKNVPTLIVLRHDGPVLTIRKLSSYVFGLMWVCAIVYWLAADSKMASILIGGTLATLVVLGLVTLAVLYLLRLLPLSRISAWGIGIRNLTRHPMRNVTQILAFGVAMMALLLLTMIRGDILDLWQDALPQDSPNQFIINIQPQQVPALETFFKQQQRPDVKLFPIVRARFIAINGERLDKSSELSNKRGLTRHEYKLSWDAELQSDNQIVDGQWWGADSTVRQFSIEEHMAKSLGIDIGDELTFSITDTPVSAKVTSLRKVQWDSFKPNFYVLTPPGMLDGHPVSYITSLYLDDKQDNLVSKLVAEFPNLTVINVSDLIQQIRGITYRVSLAVEYMFVLTVLTGLVLLLTAIQVSYHQRRQESAVMRAIGASRRQIFQAVLAEFLVLGAVAGFIAVLFAAITAYIMADQMFQQRYYPGIEYWLWGIVSGAVGIALLGRFSLRKIVVESPMRSLLGGNG